MSKKKNCILVKITSIANNNEINTSAANNIIKEYQNTTRYASVDRLIDFMVVFFLFLEIFILQIMQCFIFLP